jgi:hypothetical protein
VVVEAEVWEPLSATEIDAEVKDTTPPSPITPDDKTRYCACGCGEIVRGSATLKRGHTLAPGISRQWDASDLLVVQTAIVMMLLAITSWLENNRGIIHMEMEEAQAIANPVGRIVARHFPIKKALPGDVADVFAIASAMFSYTLRVTDAKGKKKSATNGSNSDIQNGYGPLEQYAYNPSNYQPPKSENGTPN